MCGLDEVRIWGTGSPMLEFLHVDDLADVWCSLERYDEPEPIDVGVGDDLSILELARGYGARVVGYEGRITTDPSKPDGTPRKLLDVSRLNALRDGGRGGLTGRGCPADLRVVCVVTVSDLRP